MSLVSRATVVLEGPKPSRIVVATRVVRPFNVVPSSPGRVRASKEALEGFFKRSMLKLQSEYLTSDSLEFRLTIAAQWIKLVGSVLVQLETVVEEDTDTVMLEGDTGTTNTGGRPDT